MRHQRYFEEFKRSVVEKLLSRGSRPVALMLDEVGKVIYEKLYFRSTPYVYL